MSSKLTSRACYAVRRTFSIRGGGGGAQPTGSGPSHTVIHDGSLATPTNTQTSSCISAGMRAGACFEWRATATARVCVDDIAVRAAGIWGQIEGKAVVVLHQ